MNFDSAIKTEYRGTQFKSRLEANAAFFVNSLGHDWKYEPQSFLLENGVHYIPDLFVPRLGLWVEARGYESEHGNLQIAGFSEMVGRGIKTRSATGWADYLVIGPNDGECKFYESERLFGAFDGNAVASGCEKCGAVFVHSMEGSYSCRCCGMGDGDHHLVHTREISFCRGEVLMGGNQICDWASLLARLRAP